MKFLQALLGLTLLSSSTGFQQPAVPRPIRAALASNSRLYMSDRDMNSVQEWAAGAGVQRADGLEFVSEDGEDYFAVTTQDMPAGSPVLFVPAHMVLSSEGAQQEFREVAASARELLSRLGMAEHIPLFFLFLKVLKEYENGPESPWAPWVSSLPQIFYNAVSMTDFCYECLPPLVFSLARQERVKFDNFMTALEKVDIISPGTKINKDLCKWAFNVVQTRQFEQRIAPIGDLFNHGSVDTEVAYEYDGEGNMQVYTTTDVPANTPLRMTYGDPTNPSHLFATYGFLDETSPATFCKIMSIRPTPELLDLGLDFSRMLFYKDTGDISPEVWDVMLYDHLNSNRAVQQAFYQAHMTGDEATKSAIHQEYFYETSSALKKHVDTFLQTLDDLAAKTEGKDVSEHPRLPLIWKHNDFVRQTFLMVKAQLDPMVAQASGEPVMY